MLDVIDKISGFLPAVEGPKTVVNFKSRLMWTLGILLLFLIMSQITLYGVSTVSAERFAYMELILGSKIGSLLTLGIGPIVMASIILQLLVGAKLLPIDLNKPEGRERFQGLQKLTAIFFCFFEAAAYVMFGAIAPSVASPLIYTALIVQLAFGGFLVLLMDEVISKWGIGSGVSLFIAAGVGKQIFVQAFNPLTGGNELPIGAIPQFIAALGIGNTSTAMDAIIPVLATIAVFFVVVYVQGIKVEIPLAFGSVSGFGRRWPLKFIYTSNIPVILTAALLANLQLVGSFAHGGSIPILGTFDDSGRAITGLIYYLSMPNGALLSMMHGTFTFDMGLQVLGFTLFMALGSMIFSILWVQTSGMDAAAVSNQIQSIGFQIPGFRRDPRIIEQVLDRYIMPLAVMGGLFVGLLASFADITGALGTGTGILLTVMIIYNFYEQISMRYVEEMNPALRKFFE